VQRWIVKKLTRDTIWTVVGITFGLIVAAFVLTDGNGIRSNIEKISNYPQFISPLAYGLPLAGSLYELHNQSAAKLKYSNELDSYIDSHNLTCCLDFEEMEDFELEPIIKKHMLECRTGHHDYIVNETIGMHLDNKTESEILGMYGDC
jgi:hypothetical protein